MRRWNAIKTEKAKFNPRYPFLLPRPYEFDHQLFDLPRVLSGQRPLSSVVNCQVGVRYVCIILVSAVHEAFCYMYIPYILPTLSGSCNQ